MLAALYELTPLRIPPDAWSAWVAIFFTDDLAYHGGILIIWDRMFGTFAGEEERVRYGLTKNDETYKPTEVAFHEYTAITRDVRRARSWRERWGYMVRGPGWAPGEP